MARGKIHNKNNGIKYCRTGNHSWAYAYSGFGWAWSRSGLYSAIAYTAI